MIVENNIYQNFKSYKNFKPIAQEQQKPSRKRYILPLIGSTIGVGAGMVLSKNYKGKGATLELKKILTIAGLSNFGGIALGSIGKNKEQVKAKAKEGAYQIMNISIPMVMVTGANMLCNKVKELNNVPSKIIGSIAGMTLGAMTAIKITNLGKKNPEEKRKYSIKDSVANFDDVVATIAIGFEKVNEKIHADKFLPFIYIYSGMRAGAFEDKNSIH